MSDVSENDGVATTPVSDQVISEPRGTAPPPRDALDDKVNRVFAGKVVRKDSSAR